MNFVEKNIVYISNMREAIYYSIINVNRKYYLYSNQWKEVYQTIVLNSRDGINFSTSSERIFKDTGSAHNFCPFYGKDNQLYGIGGIDNWKFDQKFHDIIDYESFVKTYEEKFKKSSKNEVFNLIEHRRLLSDKIPLKNTRGLYLFKSENGKNWKQLSELPIITIFNDGFLNAINLFGKSSEFDGHINCIYKPELDEYIIYLRANVSKGKRFIQYARSKDLIKWSRFNLIKLDVYNNEDNYYTPCFMKYKEMYIGFIPYFNVNNVCALRFVVSDDGVNWKFIKDIYKDTTSFYRGEKPKNTKHMVNGYIDKGDKLYFYIHNNFSGLTPHEPVTIQRLSIDKKDFEKFLHYEL